MHGRDGGETWWCYLCQEEMEASKAIEKNTGALCETRDGDPVL